MASSLSLAMESVRTTVVLFLHFLCFANVLYEERAATHGISQDVGALCVSVYMCQ